ncbi:hypothetical protein LXL04_038228 [Taraxacum kok-saghyz]
MKSNIPVEPKYNVENRRIRFSLTHTHKAHTSSACGGERLSSYFGSLLALKCLIRIIFRVSATEDSEARSSCKSAVE